MTRSSVLPSPVRGRMMAPHLSCMALKVLEIALLNLTALIPARVILYQIESVTTMFM